MRLTSNFGEVELSAGDIVTCRLTTNKTNTVEAASFTGSGLNDCTAGGTYTGSTNSTFDVEIDSTGTPDTFRWRKDGGSWNVGVAITGAAQTLSDGVTVTFGATTGHTVADAWEIDAYGAVGIKTGSEYSYFCGHQIR